MKTPGLQLKAGKAAVNTIVIGLASEPTPNSSDTHCQQQPAEEGKLLERLHRQQGEIVD